jgi:Tfp pilus assembly protein PilN
MRDRINLLPPEIIRKRKAAKRNFYLVSGFVVFMVFMVLIYFVLLVQVRFAESDLQAVKQERELIRSTIFQYKIYEDRQDEFNKLETKSEKAKVGFVRWSNLLNKMTLLMPSQVFFQSLKGDETGMSAEIKSTDFIGVASTIIQLNNIEEFSDNVTLNEITKDEKSGLLDFKVEAKFRTAQTSSASTNVTNASKAGQ